MEVEKVAGQYIDEYNNHRIHSAIDYIRPVDFYKGNPAAIKNQRIEKLVIAEERRLSENRKFNRVLKMQQPTSYFNTAFCSI